MRKEYSLATDVYSAGMCLYEMLMGELPFKPKDLNNFLGAKIGLKIRNTSGNYV